MSRIGKEPVAIPAGVTLTLKGQDVSVKGPKGELSFSMPAGIACEVEGNVARFTRADDERQTKAYHGLTRAIVKNMVVGVTEGYAKHLDIEGVGFKFDLKGKELMLSIGYANPKAYAIPDGVKIDVTNQGLHCDITGISKELVGRVAADIRAFKPAEPYKGKGIRYTGEKIRRKEGKTVA